MEGYLPLLLIVLVAAGLAAGMLILTMILGPRRPTRVKAEPFECGMEPIGSPRRRFPVKFYVVALLFIVFDVEAAFLYPWAILYRELGLFGLVEMGIFVLVLALGLAYVWKAGALEWES